MTNKEIKQLFEEKLEKTNWNFNEWIEYEICTKKEMNHFSKWLNSLDENEVCKYIQDNGTILSIITNQTKDMCKWAILNNVMSIEFVKKQTKEISEFAIKEWPFAIELIREQTVDLCILALSRNKLTYEKVRIVPNPDYKTTLKI